MDSYDPPFKGLHEDLNFVSPRIGEVIFFFSAFMSSFELLISPMDPFLVIKPLISDSFHHTALPLLSVRVCLC